MWDPGAARREHVQALRAEQDRLVAELAARGARLIVLFGSMAAGAEGLFSDVDLLVVIESRLPFAERLAHYYRELSPKGADLLIYTPAEFERLRSSSAFVRRILAQGRILHEERD